MTCWRCGRSGEHADFCSDGTPNDCTHCGGNPCRWWCAVSHVYAWVPTTNGRAVIVGKWAA